MPVMTIAHAFIRKHRMRGGLFLDRQEVPTKRVMQRNVNAASLQRVRRNCCVPTCGAEAFCDGGQRRRRQRNKF